MTYDIHNYQNHHGYHGRHKCRKSDGVSKSGISRGNKWLIYCIFSFMSISGMLWVVMNYAMESNMINLYIKHKVLMIHGVSAYCFVFIFGMLWDKHIKKWFNAKKKTNFKSGVLNVFLLFSLGLTGLMLYYIGSDCMRNITSLAHIILGCSFVIGFVLHSFKRFRSLRL